jgi:protein-tyrosine phosphatase
VPDQTFRITAVCLGNICRSPIAEAVLRDRVIGAGLGDVVVVDSAGTGDWHLGYPADPRSLETLAANQYDLDGHIARQITHDWFDELGLVLAMDSANYKDLLALASVAGVQTDVHMFRAFDPALSHLSAPHPELDVPDPYYGGVDGFSDVLAMIEQAADGLVAQLPSRLAL